MIYLITGAIYVGVMWVVFDRYYRARYIPRDSKGYMQYSLTHHDSKVLDMIYDNIKLYIDANIDLRHVVILDRKDSTIIIFIDMDAATPYKDSVNYIVTLMNEEV